jgi:hypothetical protein
MLASWQLERSLKNYVLFNLIRSVDFLVHRNVVSFFGPPGARNGGGVFARFCTHRVNQTRQ